MLRGSIVIPAHNEESVIGRCLDALGADGPLSDVEIVVVCNGCTDRTVEVARRHGEPLGAKVLDIPKPSKVNALRVGDSVAKAFPRAYIDADIEVSAATVLAVLGLLSQRSGPQAARPPISYDLTGVTTPVRAFYQARARTPELMRSLWGAGFYAVSEMGRARWSLFPLGQADDLFIDSLFGEDEKTVADCPPVVVRTPRDTRSLLHTLRRIYRPAPDETAATQRSSLATLRCLMGANRATCRDFTQALTYVLIALWARISVSRSLAESSWERDESTRQVVCT